MGTLLQSPGWSHVKTGTGDWNLLGTKTRTAVAAATPFPSPFALNNAGAVVTIGTVPRLCVPEPFWSVIVALPVRVPAGTSKVIRAGDTSARGASRAVPELS